MLSIKYFKSMKLDKVNHIEGGKENTYCPAGDKDVKCDLYRNNGDFDLLTNQGDGNWFNNDTID